MGSRKFILASSAFVLCLIAGCSPKGKDDSGDGDESTEAGMEQRAFDAEAVENFEQTAVVRGGDSTGLGDLSVERANEEEDLNAILPECGIDDLSDPDKETFSTIMEYDYVLEINAGIAAAHVPITSVLDLSGTLSATTLDVGVRVGEVAGDSVLGEVDDLTPIDDRAETLASTFRGPVTAYSVPRNSNFHEDWRGILCTVTGAESQINLRGGFETEVAFDPPIAPNISPIAERQRYETELGEYRFFDKIKATVTETNNPLLVKGGVYEGSILIEKIPNAKDSPHGRVQGDTAYRVSYRFVNDEITLALGFHLWTEYYIDHKQHAFSAVIANVGDVEIMHFLGKYEGDGLNEVTP